MATDALLAALKSIADENGLERIDIGYAPYGNGDALVSIWFDAPEGIIGHASEHGSDIDTAIDKALATKAQKLSVVQMAEAA